MPAVALESAESKQPSHSQSRQTVQRLEAGPQERRWSVSLREGKGTRGLHTGGTAGGQACLCSDFTEPFTGNGSAIAGDLTLQPPRQCAPQEGLAPVPHDPL